MKKIERKRLRNATPKQTYALVESLPSGVKIQIPITLEEAKQHSSGDTMPLPCG